MIRNYSLLTVSSFQLEEFANKLRSIYSKIIDAFTAAIAFHHLCSFLEITTFETKFCRIAEVWHAVNLARTVNSIY